MSVGLGRGVPGIRCSFPRLRCSKLPLKPQLRRLVTEKLAVRSLITSGQRRFVKIDMENIAGSTIPSRRLFVSFESSWEKWEDMELETALVDHFTREYLSKTHHCHHHVA